MLAAEQQPVKVIYISAYTPRKCGIATFAKDLNGAINTLNPNALGDIIALNDSGQEYSYPWEVKLRIAQHKKADYIMASHYINQSSADIVSLQHEFGLFGGPEGDNSACLSAGTDIQVNREKFEEHLHSRYYILSMLERIHKPIITTFHTILSEPDTHQAYIMRRIIEQSKAVVAMTESSRQVLIDVYGCPPEKAVVIYHGVPDFTFNGIAAHKRKLRIKAEPMILTAGLIGPGKGLEYTIAAMPAILKTLPNAKLYIVGETHPVILRNEGEIYRESLVKLAKKYHVSKSIRFVNKYLDDDQLRRYYQAADFFITAYRNIQQSASGTLAWALGAGKICITTPYLYAKEVLADGAGIMIERNDSDAIAKSILSTYANKDFAHTTRKLAYRKGQKFRWPNVGLNYLNLFRLVLMQQQTHSRLMKKALA